MARADRIRQRQHRARLQEAGCGRLDLCLGRGVIEHTYELARKMQTPPWLLVERALTQYLSTFYRWRDMPTREALATQAGTPGSRGPDRAAIG